MRMCNRSLFTRPQVRTALTADNYAKFFRLREGAPNQNGALMDAMMHTVRNKAIKTMCARCVPRYYTHDSLLVASAASCARGLKL